MAEVTEAEVAVEASKQEHTKLSSPSVMKNIDLYHFLLSFSHRLVLLHFLPKFFFSLVVVGFFSSSAIMEKENFVSQEKNKEKNDRGKTK